MVVEFALGHQGHNAHDRRFNSYRNLTGTATGHGKASGLWTEMRSDVRLAQMRLPERFLNSLCNKDMGRSLALQVLEALDDCVFLIGLQI